ILVFKLLLVTVNLHCPRCQSVQIGVLLENGIYGHSRFCNTDFDDKLACLNLSGV
ncbi:cation transporter, partial [Salmonella enterica subsp. enterica serovar Bareilly]|nr:cation transporter [Salmonella enterica subsp. enterica serovar Bareilly]